MSKLIAYGEITVTNLTEPFSVILTNEAQQFSTNASRVSTTAQTYYTDIIVYQGNTQRTDYSIGNISSANGITVSQTSSRITFSVASNTTISTDSGTFSIPITLDGNTVNKTFSWSCAKQGTSGSTGASAKAIDITASSQVFKSTDGGLTFSPDTIALTPRLQGGLTFSKWQYSINGGVDWADVASGSHGLTVASGVLTISKSSDLFTDSITTLSFKCISNNSSYFDIMTIIKLYDITDIQIGGTQILRGTNATTVLGTGAWSNSSWRTAGDSGTRNSISVTDAPNPNIKLGWSIISSSNSESDIAQDNVPVTVGQTYTLSCYAKGTGTLFLDYGKGPYVSQTTTLNNVTTWTKYSFTFIVGAKSDGSTNGRTNIFFGNNSPTGTIQICGMKLEIGNKATDWTPAPEDFESDIKNVTDQILENKTTINNVSQTVNKQQQEIESKVSSDTFDNTITLLQNDIDKASQGLGKWLIETYPKSLFNSDDQSKYEMSVFVSKSGLTPNQSLLINDAELSHTSNYGDNYIGYGLTFVECDSVFSITTKIYSNDACNLYLNNTLIGSCTSSSNPSGLDVKIDFRKGWNCLEIVWTESTGTDGFKFGTILSQLEHIVSMNCYYASITGRENQIVSKCAELKLSIDKILLRVENTETGVKTLDEKTQELDTKFAELELTDEKIESTVSRKIGEIVVGTRNLIRNSKNLIYADYSFDSDTLLTTANSTVLTDSNDNILLI